MGFCNNCGCELDASVRFCPRCGRENSLRTPQEGNRQPIELQATSAATTTPGTGAKVKGFVGMGLGIGALIFAVISLILVGPVMAYPPVGGALLVYGIFTVGLAIPGMLLSGKAIGAGVSGKPPELGKLFGLISLIAGGLALLVSLIAMFRL